MTVNGAHVYIEDGMTVQEALKGREKAGKLLNSGLGPAPHKHEAKIRSLMKSNRLPKGIKPLEALGGTMDVDGNPVDMRKFKDGYLVSCGNDAFPENREFLTSDEGRAFINAFMSRSDDGEAYVGSWYENGRNNNEPTIWIRDKDKAIKLARLLGQYAITDCAAYNKYGCENYKELPAGMVDHIGEVFIDVCDDESHKVRLKEVDIDE